MTIPEIRNFGFTRLNYESRLVCQKTNSKKQPPTIGPSDEVGLEPLPLEPLLPEDADQNAEEIKAAQLDKVRTICQERANINIDKEGRARRLTDKDLDNIETLDAIAHLLDQIKANNEAKVPLLENKKKLIEAKKKLQSFNLANFFKSLPRGIKRKTRKEVKRCHADKNCNKLILEIIRDLLPPATKLDKGRQQLAEIIELIKSTPAKDAIYYNERNNNKIKLVRRPEEAIMESISSHETSIMAINETISGLELSLTEQATTYAGIQIVDNTYEDYCKNSGDPVSCQVMQADLERNNYLARVKNYEGIKSELMEKCDPLPPLEAIPPLPEIEEPTSSEPHPIVKKEVPPTKANQVKKEPAMTSLPKTASLNSLSFLPSWFNFGARLGVGYGDLISGRIRGPQLLSDKARGIISKGSISGTLKFSESAALQLDYHLAAPYEVAGENDLLYDFDDIRLTLLGNKLGRMKGLFLQAGYKNYRNDFPSKTNPDFHGLIANARTSINIGKSDNPEFASLNIGANLIAGQTNTFQFGEQGDFDFVSAEGEVGASFLAEYKNSKVLPYFGFYVGYKELEEKGGLGGYGGFTINPADDSWELNALFKGYFLGQQTLTPIGRLFVNVNDSFSVGGQIYGDILFDQSSQKAGFGLTAQIAPLESFKALVIQPYFNAAAMFNGPSKPAILSGGITFRLGDQAPARLAELRPYSISPLPEEE